LSLGWVDDAPEVPLAYRPARSTHPRNRQYAGSEDDRIGRRDVHLRPSLEVTRSWPWAQAVDLDERGAMTSDVRTAVAEVLSALGEPPPAFVVKREDG
jgi:hypothetical protein